MTNQGTPAPAYITEDCKTTFEQTQTYGKPDDEKDHFVEITMEMQMRFDGMVGFPGGLMDRVYNEIPVECLNRELQEEINLNLDEYKFEKSHYAQSHVNHRKKLVTHFYVKEVTPAQLQDIERSTLGADDWGSETFGTIRVPLFVMDDGYRGLPVFLANIFAGNAREQLLQAIVKCNLLTQEQCNILVENYRKYSKD